LKRSLTEHANQNIRAVVFDCDGVMFDSRQANILYYNHMLHHFGLPPMTGSAVDFVHSHTVDESIRHIFQGTPYTNEALDYRWKVDYTPFIQDMIMEPGLKELLEWLKPRYGLAVATNRSNTMEEVLKTHGLTESFDIVVSSLDVEHSKPHPESLLKILDFFQVGPDRILYVGDSVVDEETARRAGVPFIAYRNKALKAYRHVSIMTEIKDLLNHPA
jgi:phosphoglycolate phosphatase-like HAD superfamily hydrolase